MIHISAPESLGLKRYAALVLASAVAVLSSSASAQNNLRIGLAAPISGPLSNAGRAMAAGFDLGAKDASARLNRTIIPIVENDDGSTAGARNAAQALLDKGTHVVVGHYTSAATRTGNALYARKNVLLIAPSASSPKLIEPKSANVLRLGPREDSAGLFAGRYLAREFPSTQIAIVSDGSVTSSIFASAAKSAWNRQQTKPVIEAQLLSTPGDAVANAAQLVQTLNGKNVAAIYWTGGVSMAGTFLRALQATGANTPVIASETLATPEFPAAAGDATEGLRMTILAITTQSAQAQSIAARMKAEGVRDIPLALATYASVQVVTETAARLDTLDSARLAAALRGGAPIETIVGPVSFDVTGERREQLYTIAIWKKAADGKFIFTPQ